MIGAPIDATRRVRRVAPLGDEFVLDLRVAAASPLNQRVAFVALADESAAQSVMRTLTAGLNAAVTNAGVFADMLDRSWAAFQRPSDVGLPTLVDDTEFLGALRMLADDLLMAGHDEGGYEVLIDVSPGHRNRQSLESILSVYPDATVITDDALLSELPQQLAAHVMTLRNLPSLAVADRHPAPAVRGQSASTPSPLSDKLIVVVGAGRSGTTWLQQLLLAHPDVTGAEESETWLFEQLSRVWERRQAFGLQDEQLGALLRKYCDNIFTAGRVRHRPTAQYVVEKTPVHSFLLPQILATYPEAWVVHLLRDGREVARSMADVPFFGVDDVRAAAELWQRTVGTVRADSRIAQRFREIRYEQLQARPEETAKALFEWVGLRVDEGAMRAVSAAASRRVSAHARAAGALGEPGWRTLPRKDIAELYSVLGRDLVATGYARRHQVLLARLSGGRVLFGQAAKPRRN